MKLVHWLVTLPIAILAVLFAISNLDPVPVGLWPFAAIDLPLYLVALGALALGFVGGELVAWINGRHWRREARKRQRRIEALERELEAKSGAPALPTAAAPRD